MAQAYTSPDWYSGEGISASNLQSISNVLEGIVQGSDRAIHHIEINGSNLVITYVDGTTENFAAIGLKGIINITKTSSGGIDTYTIHYTDGTTYSFDVVNGASLEVVDDLTSTSKTSALSANQGRVLNEKKADIETVSALNEDLTQTKADLKASSTITSSEDLDYSINGNIVSADFVGYARKEGNTIIKPSGVVESSVSNLIGLDTNRYKVKEMQIGDKITLVNKTSSSLELYIYAEVGASSRVDYWSVGANTTRTITLATKCKEIKWNNVPNGLAWVNEGAKELPYQPYKAPSTITLPYIPLGVNDIKDELIVYADGTGKFVKRVDSVDLGSLTWTYYAKVFYASITDYIHTNTSINYICDTYTEKPQTSSSDAMYNNGDKTVALYYPSTLSRVYVRDDSVGTDANALKNALNGKNIYIVLATPTETPLTSAEVEQILALKTFADVTYIDADGMTYEIGYLINAGKAIKDLMKAINNASALNTVSMLSDNVTVSTPKKSIAKVADVVEEVKEDLTEKITEEIPTEEV